VVLKSGSEVTDLLACIDTGASNCLFERNHGELLNLEIETGDHRIFRAATGGIDAFGHVVELEMLGLKFEIGGLFFRRRKDQQEPARTFRMA
jgi:hypothetical protein